MADCKGVIEMINADNTASPNRVQPDGGQADKAGNSLQEMLTDVITGGEASPIILRRRKK